VTDPGAVRRVAGLHAADPDDVADTLRGVAGCGLYFAVGTGGWTNRGGVPSGPSTRTRWCSPGRWSGSGPGSARGRRG